MLQYAPSCHIGSSMAKFQIRIERENQSNLARAAKANMRSVVKEANKILADYFASRAPAKPGQP
jgi:hypothetical protein